MIMKNRPPADGASRRLLIRSTCVTLALGPVSSCSNPLGPIDADYDRNLAAAPERLRSIGRFDNEQFARPAPDPDARPDLSQPPPSRLSGLASIPLTIEQARAAALANNLDLRVALVNPAIDAERLREEEAKFEAVFVPRAGYAEQDAPTLDRTAPNQQDLRSLGAGVSIPLRSGGRASVDFTQGYNETDNPFFAFNSSHTSDLQLSLSQPLLRGAGRRANTYSIRVAEYNRQIGEAATKLEVIRLLAAVDRVYWVLTARREELDVRLKEFQFAQDDLARTRRLFEAGASDELAVINAEAAAAAKLEPIINAENEVLRQQRELKRLMNMPDLPLDSATLVQTTTPAEAVPFAFDRAELTRRALADRMELLQLELRLASDYSTIEFAKNQALPSFVLDYRYSINGLGRSLHDSAEQLRENDFESWSINLRGEIPIGNEAARARVKQAILSRLQRLSTRQSQRQAVEQEVLGALDAVEATWQRILAARQRVFSENRAYAAERRRVEAGARTTIDLFNALTRLADAQTALVLALGQYQIAQVDLAFATGTLLGAGRIDWSPLDESDQPGSDPTPPAFPLYADPAKAMAVPQQGRPLEPTMTGGN